MIAGSFLRETGPGRDVDDASVWITYTFERRRYPGREELTMIHVMRADDRHCTDFGWLQTYWLFSLSA